MNPIASPTVLLGRFLDRELLTLTRNGALGRARIYANGVNSEKEGKPFRDALDAWLQRAGNSYRTRNVDDREHVKNIEELSSRMSEDYRSILRGGSFWIGPAQKALNLYLKYQWARGLIAPPPRCSIDSIVLGEIRRTPAGCNCPICKTVTWTAMDDIGHYEHIIAVAKRVAQAGGCSLPEWELRIWHERSAIP